MCADSRICLANCRKHLSGCMSCSCSLLAFSDYHMPPTTSSSLFASPQETISHLCIVGIFSLSLRSCQQDIQQWAPSVRGLETVRSWAGEDLSPLGSAAVAWTHVAFKLKVLQRKRPPGLISSGYGCSAHLLRHCLEVLYAIAWTWCLGALCNAQTMQKGFK